MVLPCCFRSLNRPWNNSDISFRSDRTGCYARSKNCDIKEIPTQELLGLPAGFLCSPPRHTTRLSVSHPGENWSKLPRIFMFLVVLLSVPGFHVPRYRLLARCREKHFKNACISQVEMSRLRAVCCLPVLTDAIKGLVLASVLFSSFSRVVEDLVCQLPCQ